MKTIVILLLAVILSVALAEPIKYRQNQQEFRATARLESNKSAKETEETTEGSGNNENDDNNNEAEQTTDKQLAYLYLKPNGQLLVLPIRGNLESTTTVESSTFDDTQTTTDNPTTEQAAANANQLEMEEAEPKTKKLTAAYRKGPLKFSGQLKLGNDKESSESNEASTTTEANDESASTEESVKNQTSGALETTSEPDSEAVEAENTGSNPDEQKTKQTEPQPGTFPPQSLQPAFFVQLPDGSFQRVIYLTPPPMAQPAIIPPVSPVPSGNLQFQQLVQPQGQSFGFNPIANPRIVTFTSQYQAY